MSSSPFLDVAGERVVRFMSEARNLTRIGELTDEVVAIAESGAWRRYKTALGVDEWRERELDYFLIASEIGWDDSARVIAYTRKSNELVGMMDPNAPTKARRTLEEASAAWHAPGPETLLERAVRLGWAKPDGSTRRPPVSPRSLAKYARGGQEPEEHARTQRALHITAKRRRELDALAKRVRVELADDLERRYLLDRLRATDGAGRPRTSSTHLDAWRADAERLNWETAELAKHWGVTPQAARARVRRLREGKAK